MANSNEAKRNAVPGRVATAFVVLALAVCGRAVAQKPAVEAVDPAVVARHEALLDDALKKKDERQAREAIRLLGKYPADPGAAKALLRAAAEKGVVGGDAVVQLVQVAAKKPKGVDVVPRLVAMLGRKSVLEDVARARTICSVLGAIGDGRAATTLIKLMKHRDLSIASAAIGATPGLKSKRHKVIERMIGDLESLGSQMRDSRDPAKGNRYAVLGEVYAGAINAMTGQYFGTDTVEIRRWWKRNKRNVPNKLEPPKKTEPKPPSKGDAE